MAHAFVAFIDEAGDEGFNIVPRPAKKSSEWFIMSAVVVRANQVHILDYLLRGFRQIHGGRTFHFRKARHLDRVAFLDALKFAPFRIVSIAVHKGSTKPQSTLRTQPHQLYHYTSKLLIERISWSCDELSQGELQCMVRLAFSDRR
jgi:hypothetical protein